MNTEEMEAWVARYNAVFEAPDAVPVRACATVEELIRTEMRHLPMAVHLDVKKAFVAGWRGAIADAARRGAFSRRSPNGQFVPTGERVYDGKEWREVGVVVR